MNPKTKKIVIISIFIIVIVLIIFYATRSSEDQVTETKLEQRYNNNYDSIIETEENQTSSSSNSDNNDQVTILEIEKIGISAPIILNVDGNDMENYLKTLENGVAHMNKTALPGAVGNSVIFGHSSYYRSKPGSYKTVFAPLDELSDDDLIKITFNENVFQYRVSEIKKIQPEETSVVEQNNSNHKLTLITCWPPTTTDQRLVIVANLVE